MRKTKPTKFDHVLSQIRKATNNRAGQFLGLWLASYLVLMAFFINTVLGGFRYLEVFPGELIFPSAMHAMSALIITLVIFWQPWLKVFASKLVSVMVFTLCIVGYDNNFRAVAGVIRAITPGLTDSDPEFIVSLIYLLLLLCLAISIGLASQWLSRRSQRIKPKDITMVVLVAVAYMFAVPAISMAKILPTMIKESRVQAETLGIPKSTSPSEKPDIYYIVLDRYTNNTTLRDQFKYDNSRFTNFLSENDFYINEKARSNYPYTATSMASTLNAQYHNDLLARYKDNSMQSHTLYHNLIWQSSVVKAFKAQGYKYYSLGSEYGATYKAPLADKDYKMNPVLKVFGRGKRLRGIEDVEFQRSPYRAFAQVTNAKWWPLQSTSQDHIADVREQINTLDELASSEKPGGRLIVAHMLVPHDPFVFNADGSISPDSGLDSIGQPIQQKYLQQIQFINNQIEELVTKIRSRSNGKSVVLLNSDEGPYPQLLNSTFKRPQVADQAAADAGIKDEDMRGWADSWLEMKFGILQAVHIPKASKVDLENLSSVNLFRIVLNRYAGYDLPYLPNCQFGLIHGGQHMYNYANLSKKFEPLSDKQCDKLQSLPSSMK